MKRKLSSRGGDDDGAAWIGCVGTGSWFGWSLSPFGIQYSAEVRRIREKKKSVEGKKLPIWKHYFSKMTKKGDAEDGDEKK